jgi:hypothetical protein
MLNTGWPKLLLAAGVAGTAVMLPLVLAGGAVQEASAVARQAGAIFQPWQVWWFLGEPGVVVGNLGEKPGYRVPLEWLTGLAHPLLVLVPAAVSLALVPRLRRRPWHDGLLLLAFVLLLRCVLDPWNISYYSIPFLFALVAWEIHATSRAPLLSLPATLLAWFTLVWLTTRVHPDLQAAAYLAWSMSLAALMGGRLLGLRPGQAVRPSAGASRSPRPAERTLA